MIFNCSHGFAEYFCPSYDEISEALVKNGYLIFSQDHIGHGRSSGERAIVKNFDEYVSPLLAHVMKVKNDFKEVPLSIIGHSMGGLISIYAAMAQPNLFNCIVLMGPLIKLDPNVATCCKKTLSSVLGSWFPSVIIAPLEETLITRDKDVVKRVMEDPLGRVSTLVIDFSDHLKGSRH